MKFSIGKKKSKSKNDDDNNYGTITIRDKNNVTTVNESSSPNKQQVKTKKKKQKKRSTDFAYSYSIIPTNFINLSEEAQMQRLGQFFDILNVIDDRIKITMSRRIVPIIVEGQTQNMPVMQVHVESHMPLADTLEQNRLEYIAGVSPPQFRILKEHFSMMEIVETESKNAKDGNGNENDNDNDDNNNYKNNNDHSNDNITLVTGEKLFSKTFTLDGIPATLPYAWITKIFGLCSQIQMWYNPLDKDEAIVRMARFKNIIYDDAQNNRITSELYKRADDTETLFARIQPDCMR